METESPRPSALPREAAAGGPARPSPAADARFILTLLLSLVFMGILAAGRLASPPEGAVAGGGARPIDVAAYRALLDEGRLSDREALFSHGVDPAPSGHEAPAAR